MVLVGTAVFIVVGAAAKCNYPCEVGAKGSSHVTTVPAAIASGKFDMRLDSYIFRIDTDSSGKATGVRYYDFWAMCMFSQQKLFLTGIWGFNLVRLMLLSGIGNPYDPVAHTGSLGRGLANGYTPCDFKRKHQTERRSKRICQRKCSQAAALA